MTDLDLFFRYLKGRCHGNRFCEKKANTALSWLWHSETEWHNAVYMHDLIASLMPNPFSSVYVTNEDRRQIAGKSQQKLHVFSQRKLQDCQTEVHQIWT